MNLIITMVLIAVGLIHLLPAVGMLGPERLRNLYAIELANDELILLMRHRAVLFGLLGCALLGAASRPDWQGWALAAAVISTASFILLAGNEAYNAAVRRVILVDWMALGALGVASSLWLWRRYLM